MNKAGTTVRREVLVPVFLAGGALTAAMEERLADCAEEVVTADDSATLQADHPLAIVTWLAERPAIVRRCEVPGLLNELVGPLIFSALTRLLGTEIADVIPVERVGRIYTLDVQPKGMPDPQVMAMIPVDLALEPAWETYYQAVRHLMRFLVEGRERVERIGGVVVDAWGMTVRAKTRRVVLPHLANARRAFLGAIERFVELAPDKLTVEELAYLLSRIVAQINGLSQSQS